jgi:hypothetical protein
MCSFALKQHSERGSVLIVAMCFAAIIAISLTSYIALATNSLKQSSRSFYASSAVNLAETGLEEAIACFNKLDDVPVGTPEAAWTGGWTLNNTPYDASASPFTPAATRIFTGFNAGPGATGTVKVFAQHFTGATLTGPDPKIVAQTTITQPDGPPIHKFIEVTLRKRSLFGNGVTSILDVSSTGGTISIKSWDSDPDNDPATAAIPYDITRKTANATVASTQGNIDLGGGTHVEGFAMVSPGHSIAAITHGTDTTVNDPDRQTYDYDASFTKEDAPTGVLMNTITANVGTSKIFPDLATDNPATVGGNLYYYNFGSLYDINLSGGDNIQILAGKDVVFVLNKTGSSPRANSVNTGGSAYINIQAGATLTIYAAGDVTLAGGGLLNDNFSASTFRLYGTNTVPWSASGDQIFKVAGSSEFRGVIYAPNGLVEIKGGGSDGRFIGAVVGRRIAFNGNTEFIFDEQINDLTKPDYAVRRWKELQHASERALYSSAFNSF